MPWWIWTGFHHWDAEQSAEFQTADILKLGTEPAAWMGSLWGQHINLHANTQSGQLAVLRRSSRPVEHGKHLEYLSMGMYFPTLKGWREREREARKDGVLCGGIVRCLSTKEMREQLHNDPLWGGERCPGHGPAPSLGSATQPEREMFIKPHCWAKASSHWQGPVAWEALAPALWRCHSRGCRQDKLCPGET